MKYDEKYPNAGTERWDWADVPAGIFKTKDANPCGHCHEHTHFIDVNLESPICSDECDEAYIHAMNEASDCQMKREAARVAGTDHEFEPDDESATTASCHWCGKEVVVVGPDADWRPLMEGKCSARVGTDNV